MKRKPKDKDKRQPYYGSKAVDRTCRNHGSCTWCRNNRLHATQKRIEATRDQASAALSRGQRRNAAIGRFQARKRRGRITNIRGHMKRILILISGLTIGAGAAVAIPEVTSVVNSAGTGRLFSYDGSSTNYYGFTPNSFITIYGRNLATTTAAATTYPWPTTLAGTSVTVGNRASATPCQIIYASPTQINLLLPNDVGPSDQYGDHSLFIFTPAGMGSYGGVSIEQEASPGLFFGDGHLAAALHAVTYQAVTANNPVSPNEYVSLYATSLGDLKNSPTIKAQIDGLPASVLWAGGAPGFKGLDQINVQVPAKVQRKANVTVTISIAESNSTTYTTNTVYLPIN